MKNILTFLFSTIFCLCNCVRATHHYEIENQNAFFETKDIQKDTLEVQKLVQQIINWSESADVIDVYPVLTKGDVYFFDERKLKENLDILRETTFFSNEFIENYNQLILTLDRKLKSKEFDRWMVGDLPPFNFANDISPWCMCQGFSPEEFGGVDVVRMDNKSGELIWKWKKGSSWINFKFRVAKENNIWKVTYMQGFDFKQGIRRTGEI